MENLVFKSFIYFGYTVKNNFLKIRIYSDLMPMCLCASWCKALKVATGRPEIQVLVIVVFKSNIIIKRNNRYNPYYPHHYPQIQSLHSSNVLFFKQ